ncbi:hypothetical protein ABI59_04225 [Acidobacteria bacterium Mor1]|nr:hypothetical protein ABI59_04225 [Acidobacteria bacterium Mor1]
MATFRTRDQIDATEARDVGRLAKRQASSLIYTLMIVVATLLALAISMRLGGRIDLSKQGTNQLSPQSLSMLAGLQEPVKLYALYASDGQALEVRKIYLRMLDLYLDASDKISYEFFDVTRTPGIIDELELDRREHGVLNGLTVAVRGDRRIVFRGEDEESITNAILEAGRAGRPVVGYVRGYGVRDPQSRAANSMQGAIEALRAEYYDVADVSLAQPIPEDVSVLWIADPRQPMPKADLDRLGQWLADGGRLIAMLDKDGDRTLNEVLEVWGMRASDQEVSDPSSHYGTLSNYLRIENYKEPESLRVHDTVRGFSSDLPTAFPGAVVVSHFETGEQLLFHTGIAVTTERGQVFTEDQMVQSGRYVIAAASWKKEEVAGEDLLTRVVLFGDADFASTGFLRERTNRDLFLNSVAWLTRQSDLISIRRQPMAGQRIEFDSSRKRTLYAVVFATPLLVLLAGFVVYMRRRGK